MLTRMLTISRSLQALAVFLLILIFAGTAAQLLHTRAALIADSESRMSQLDMVFAEQTGLAVRSVDVLLRRNADAAKAVALGPGNAGAMHDMLAREAAGMRQVTALAVADSAGTFLYSSRAGPLGGLPPAARPLLTQGLGPDPGGPPEISMPFRDVDGHWTALLARPLTDADQRFGGLAVAYLDLSYFEDFYKAVDLDDRGAIVLHRRDGTVLARFPHADGLIGHSFADLPPFKDILSHAQAGVTVMDSPLDNSRRVLAIRALKAFPLAVNVSVDESRLLRDWRGQTRIFVALAIVASVTIGGLLLLAARRARHVAQLLDQAQTAARGAEATSHRLREQIEQRERAEAALRLAQRIEAVGQLAGGVAHDFNNLLSVLLGNLELIEHGPPFDRQTADRLATMRSAAERGAALTRQLLGFVRRQPLAPATCQLDRIVAGMIDLLRSAVGSAARVQTVNQPDLWPALVDPTQIELVILNLAINARDAMNAAGRADGVLTIRTAKLRVGPATAGPERELPAGDYVLVSVADTGSGMSPEVKARAFEPFFTTKGPGAGSGLGLSQAFALARGSGGGVYIDSALGRGTTVRVILPRAQAGAPAPPRVPEPPAARPRSPARVLVVDDDEAVRVTTSMILESFGYAVAQAADAAQAVAVLRGGGPAIDAMLTDVAMPDMNGPDLARMAQAELPGLAVVFFSGYADPEMLAKASLGRPIRMVRKPFRPAELRSEIEAALAERVTV